MSSLLGEVFNSRPFALRNAEEFELDKILDLFVSPREGLQNPFTYENAIVKGRMGSGKTMYLRANYAYHLYSIVPSLLSDNEPVLPVYLKLSDFQHIRKPEEVYRQIVLTIIERLASIHQEFSDAQRLANVHRGIRRLPYSFHPPTHQSETMNELLKLSADEYVEKATRSLGVGAKLKHALFEASATYKEERYLELRGKLTAGIADIGDVHRSLFPKGGGKVLLLIDEAGSVDKSFFRGSEDSGTSLFETLMNQLRTADYIRTKVAVYPHSYSDILTETRYGDVVALTDDVRDLSGYREFRRRALDLIKRYVGAAAGTDFDITELFDIDPDPDAAGDLLEQIIYASGGNTRRLVHLLDQLMTVSYRETGDSSRIGTERVDACLRLHVQPMEALFRDSDREFLQNISEVCRARGTFRFKFPLKAPVLYKYISRSEEYNVLDILEPGSGRRPTLYAFDYAFCVAHDIPTHNIPGTQRVERSRSIEHGEWIRRTATISEELVQQAKIPKKEGEIVYVQGNNCFCRSEGVDYYFQRADVVDQDPNEQLHKGRRVRFFPAQMEEGSLFAALVELL